MSDIEQSAQHEADIDLLRQELRQKNERVAILESELAEFRNGKTWPPPSMHPREEPTGDHSSDKRDAELLGEVHSLRAEVLTLSREVGELRRTVAEYSPIMEQVIEALQVAPRCADCPHKPSLSLVPSERG